jgi:hypothetical protein
VRTGCRVRVTRCQDDTLSVEGNPLHVLTGEFMKVCALLADTFSDRLVFNGI